MKKIVQSLRFNFFGASTSGTFGAIGSLPNVCHSLCMGAVSLLSVFGITLNILPLMFLQTYSLYFWSAAFILTLISAYFFFRSNHRLPLDRNLLLINSGLLIFGLPVDKINLFVFLTDFMDLFRFFGVSLAVSGLLILIFGKKVRFIDYVPTQSPSHNTSRSPGIDNSYLKQEPVSLSSSLSVLPFRQLAVYLVVTGFVINQLLMYRLGFFDSLASSLPQVSGPSVMPALSKMKLTAFDIALAKERMDTNGDGVCDVCGMPIQQCIDSGQMDCNMGDNPQAIGILGSAHTHADLAVYINGEKQILAKPENFMKSSFLHLDNNQIPEDANSVLHQHAKNVPMWLFFRSIGMKLEKDSLTAADGQIYKNGDGNGLKFYLNGQKVDELGEYSYQPLDKLLISYGPENDPDLQNQINSVTNYAKDH